jgi:hypothetical protein
LEDIVTWFKDDTCAEQSVYWLSGVVGTGKTSIAQSVCRELEEYLVGSFFFSRNSEDRQRPSNVIPTLIYQLAFTQPSLQHQICISIKQDPQISTKSITKQAELLLSAEFKLLIEDLGPLLIVLDGFDECGKGNGQEGAPLLPLLVQRLCAAPSRLKIFFTSRPEASIHRIANRIQSDIRHLALHHIGGRVVRDDIERYVRAEFEEISQNRFDGGPWLADDDHEQQLIQRSGGLFIYAATAIKCISEAISPAVALSSLLAGDSSSKDSPLAVLDDMYLRIIEAIGGRDDHDISNVTCAIFRHVVGTIVFVSEPLSRVALSKISGENLNDVTSILRPLYSLLDVGPNLASPVRIFHQSFPEFLSDPNRCSNAKLCVNPEETHHTIVHNCLRTINIGLRQDLCHIGDPSLLNSEIPDLDACLKKHTSEELRYSCVYWTIHLTETRFPSPDLIQELQHFCKNHILHWLEALSLLQDVRSAIEGIPKVLEWLKKSPISEQFKVHIPFQFFVSLKIFTDS